MTTHAKVIPIAGWDSWLEVMERAGWRCQCTRPCPKHRAAGRCETVHHELHKLTGGPADPGPDPARTLALAQTDQEDLVAWCGPCWDRAVAAARRMTRSAEHFAQLDNPDARLF